jgi:hypothetical protein
VPPLKGGTFCLARFVWRALFFVLVVDARANARTAAG